MAPAEVMPRTKDPDRQDSRKLKGDASRERFLEAAAELISERGYAATGVDEICRRAGVVKSALYWHFGSKEKLLAAVIERVGKVWVEQVTKSVYREGTPESRLDRFIEGLEKIAAEKGRLLRLIVGVGFQQGDVAPAALEALVQSQATACAAIVRGCQDALGVALPDFDLIADLVMAFMNDLVLRGLVGRRSADLTRRLRHLRGLILLDLQRQLRQAGLPPL
ncbi:MAG TPA: helix-turn-helix domain-containing protein [Myxococcota bacterium]|jgi:AcrR family transcriptional regulator|nr:helix-turn-helix domain-containing protein [Myxococcota bacterium]